MNRERSINMADDSEGHTSPVGEPEDAGQADTAGHGGGTWGGVSDAGEDDTEGHGGGTWGGVDHAAGDD
jgi:hypothetical protein